MSEKGREIELANPLDELILVTKHITWVDRSIPRFGVSGSHKIGGVGLWAELLGNPSTPFHAMVSFLDQPDICIASLGDFTPTSIQNSSFNNKLCVLSRGKAPGGLQYNVLKSTTLIK